MTTTVIHTSLAMAAQREDKIAHNFIPRWVSAQQLRTSPVSTSLWSWQNPPIMYALPTHFWSAQTL